MRWMIVVVSVVACSQSAQREPANQTGARAASGSAKSPALREVWMRDEHEAFARARAEGKGVAIEFYAVWCAPCDELERSLAAPEVARALAASFVPLRIDVSESTDAMAEVRERYHARTLPALLFLDARGTELSRIERLVEPAELLSLISSAATARR